MYNLDGIKVEDFYWLPKDIDKVIELARRNLADVGLTPVSDNDPYEEIMRK